MKNKTHNKKFTEKLSEYLFLSCACMAVFSVIIISLFILFKGVPALFEIGILDFIFGTEWKPREKIFGILPMITSSLLGTIGAIIIGTSIGIFTAIFLAELSPKKIAKLVRPAVELLAGIPSVVYGFFGLVVIVPFIDKNFGGGGNSLLAVIIILSIMILPTIVSIAEVSIRSVPKEYKEGSLALGATHIQTIFKVILPAAKSGIFTAIVLGMGRAIGETMAVILVAGNSPILPDSILSRVRTLTANIALEMGYASGLHQGALFATGVVLFIFIMALNIILNLMISSKANEKKPLFQNKKVKSSEFSTDKMLITPDYKAGEELQ